MVSCIFPRCLPSFPRHFLLSSWVHVSSTFHPRFCFLEGSKGPALIKENGVNQGHQEPSNKCVHLQPDERWRMLTLVEMRIAAIIHSGHCRSPCPLRDGGIPSLPLTAKGSVLYRHSGNQSLVQQHGSEIGCLCSQQRPVVCSQDSIFLQKIPGPVIYRTIGCMLQSGFY